VGTGLIGPDYSTKFAPWLAHGCLSARLVHAECARYEKERTKNKSTYWVIFELLWRDFFKFYCARHGDDVFKVGGPIRRAAYQWEEDADGGLFRRWKEGNTGVPFVDANMRELRATGFMSNRGRQNVASYLILDLNLDWRKGAEWFEETLLDYDVCSNWGNWAAAAGLTGGRVNRFNVQKQSKDYDAAGDYIRLWVPELAQVPPPYVHAPHNMPRAAMEKYGAVIGIGGTYPSPISTRGGGGGGGGGEGGGGRAGGADGRSRGSGGAGAGRDSSGDKASSQNRGGGGRGGADRTNRRKLAGDKRRVQNDAY
jgi:deoxyribodipyrimidine photo-lyase